MMMLSLLCDLRNVMSMKMGGMTKVSAMALQESMSWQREMRKVGFIFIIICSSFSGNWEVGVVEVLKLMSHGIIHQSKIIHSYPIDWRTKQPILFRASLQWFFDTEKIKELAIVGYHFFYLVVVTLVELHSHLVVSNSRRSSRKWNSTQRQPRKEWCQSWMQGTTGAYQDRGLGECQSLSSLIKFPRSLCSAGLKLCFNLHSWFD